MSRLTYILPGHAFTQEDTGLSQYVAHEDAAVSHGNNGLPIRPETPRPARLLTGQRPREAPVCVPEHLSTEVQTETVLQAEAASQSEGCVVVSVSVCSGNFPLIVHNSLRATLSGLAPRTYTLSREA